MDFLLLLPGRQRIVLEVDGKHHFSEDDNPSLKVYANPVSADRELRLAGYEVYRFGANELVGEGSESRIADFFDKLFRLHRVRR
jgi:very-short-patch-repair endonuclease